MIQVTESTSNNDGPICPHCEREISRLKTKRIESFLGVRHAYYCPDCRKLLGISHRKGFWMG